MGKPNTPSDTPPIEVPPVGDPEVAVMDRLEKYLAALAAYEIAYKRLVMGNHPMESQCAQKLVDGYSHILREGRRVALAIRKMTRA